MPSKQTWTRRLALGAVTTATAVALSSTITPAAQAAGPPSVEVPAGTPRSDVSWTYGDSPSPRTPIAASTRRITIEHPAVAVTDVTCDFGVAGSKVSSRTVTASTWNGSVPIELAIPSGAVTSDPRKYVQVICQSRTASSSFSFTLFWSLDNTTSAPEVVPLFDDPVTRSRVYSQRYYTGAEAIKVLPGAVLTFTGAPGTWDVPYVPPWWEYEDGPAYYAYLGVTGVPGVELVPDVSPDGSTLSITVPSSVPPAFLESTAGLSLVTFGERGFTNLIADLDLNADLPSTTTLSVSPSRTLSVQRPTATVRVEAFRTRIPLGTVTIQVDGRAVATAPLTAADLGKVSVRLPSLRRGTHTVVASFAGAGLTPSVSKTVQVHVIR